MVKKYSNGELQVTKIEGMDLQPSKRQRVLMEQARELTETRLSKRAAKSDRDATFPFDDFNYFA